MARALLAVLVGVPLLTSVVLTGALVLAQARRGFDPTCTILTVFFGSMAAFLVSILVDWMRSPRLEIQGAKLGEAETRRALLHVFLSMAVTAAFIATVKQLLSR
jgi:hypothetical protein